MRFISHLDTMRTFSRAFRRARVPLSFSQGFNPHPKMSFAMPLAVGQTSSNDVLDIETEIPVDLHRIIGEINGSLPPGFRVVSAREMQEGGQSAMSEVGAAAYSVVVPTTNDTVDAGEVANGFLCARDVLVERRREGKTPLTVDIRPLVLRLEGRRDRGVAAFDMVLRAGGSASARPDEVLRAIDSMGGCWLDLPGARYHRSGVFRFGGGRMEPIL
ncbi:MAG: TIGR03936 family radical SAM-associated protein [Ignavibacteriales bacterium]